jgi:hypothetical protein
MSFIEKMSNGCWLWAGGPHGNPYTYGTFGLSGSGRKERNGRTVSIGAHQASYILFKEDRPIPKGLLVRHFCNVMRCVNPDHLSLGTSQDNSDDMVSCGRSGRGDKSHCAKLSEQQVMYYRAKFVPGVRGMMSRFAEEAEVTISAMSKAIHGDNWVGEGAVPAEPTTKIDEAGILAMREARAAGASVASLMARFGMSKVRVSNICTGLAWQDVGGPRTRRESVGGKYTDVIPERAQMQ